MTPKKPTKAEIKKKLDEQIIILNDIINLRIAPSQVHGVGVFAMRNIKKGEKLYADAIPHQFDLPYKMFKKLRPEISELILQQFPLVLNGSHFLFPVTRYIAFMNHSDTPNYDSKSDVALQAIKKGEEIFEDYRLIANYEKVYPWIKKTNVV